MTTIILTPTSKKELKAAVTSKIDGGYNYFKGEIRKGNKYVRIFYFFTGSKLTIQITYWQDGIDRAIECASKCSSPTGVVNKVSKFLDLK